MPPKYRKGSQQQYVVKQKLKQKVKSKVQQKLKKSAVKQRPKGKVLVHPKVVPAATEPTERLFAGYKAKLTYQNGGLNVSADVRYETEKTDPLVKIVNVDKNLNQVTRTFEGPAKREVYRNQNGDEVPKAEVGQAQVMPDGSLKPVKLEKTKDIKVEPVDARIANDFLPYSFLEVWGDGESDDDGLRKMSVDLMKNGKVGAIKEFSHGFGKMYVGFLKPIMNDDGTKFGVEVMLAENKRSRRRWMLAEKSPNAPAHKASAPTVPSFW